MEILGMISLLSLPACVIAVYLLCLARKSWKAVQLERSSLLAAHQRFVGEQDRIKNQHAQFEEALERRSDALRLQAEQLGQNSIECYEIWQKLEGRRQVLDEKRLQLEKSSQELKKEYQQVRDERERLEQEHRGSQECMRSLSEEQCRLRELSERLEEDRGRLELAKAAQCRLEAELEVERRKIADELDRIEQKKQELDNEYSTLGVQRESMEADKLGLATDLRKAQMEILKNEGIRKELETERARIEEDRQRQENERKLVSYDRTLLQGERQVIAKERKKIEEERQGLGCWKQRLEEERLELTELRQRLNEERAISAESPSPSAQKAQAGEAARDAKQKSHLPEIMRLDTDQAPQQTEFGGSREPKSTQDRSQTSEVILPWSPDSEEESEEINRNGNPAARGTTSSEIAELDRRIDPIKRGGGRTCSVELIPRTEPFAPKQSRPKPEIVCRKRERSWWLSVEIPYEMMETGEIRILQGGVELSKNEFREDWWDLNSLFTEVNIQVAQNSESFPLIDKGYLTFKLSARNESMGRLVKSLSSGFYLVVVAKDWERDIDISGPAPVSPEPVSLFEDHRAHFFVVGKAASHTIAFKTPGDRRAVIKSARTPKFDLTGNRFPDNVEAECPLFIDHLPKIRGAYQQAWNEVTEIIVGIEGPGREKWRKQTLPVDNLIEQELPQDILEHQCGWYFVRMYDAVGDLIESFEFKFLRGLKEIKFPAECLCPGSTGHEPVTVELIHEPYLTIKPADDNSSNVAVECTHTGTILSIPPDPRCDETEWTIGPSNAAALDVSILVERLWWTVADLESEPSEWSDKTAFVETKDFAPTSSKAIWIRFPRVSWCEGVRAGFSKERAKSYSTKSLSRLLCIPLREFCDCEALIDAPGLKPFWLWINLGRSALQLTPCNLLVRIYCRFDGCDFVVDDETEMAQHIVSHHAEEFFCQLEYEELRNLNRDLPRAIYKCPYCDNPPFYSESGDLSNPTSKICHHMDSVHRHREVQFRVVTGVEEIRENILQNLPRLFKCKSCRKRFNKEPSNSEMTDHLFMSHRNELYELR